MPHFGTRSKKNLATLHPDLQRVLLKAIETYDFTIIQGHRSEAEQHQAFISGHSKLDWPHSRHNTLPSKAADCVPYKQDSPHIDWNDIDSFVAMAEAIKKAAMEENVPIVWGGNWKMRDYPHFELA